MPSEQASWDLLRLAATTSSVCLALVGWFAHFFRQKSHELTAQQAPLERNERDARHMLSLARDVPLLAGFGAAFLVAAGLLSIWVGYDAAKLGEQPPSMKALFFVAIGGPMCAGALLFLALFPDFFWSLRHVCRRVVARIRGEPPVVLPLPEVRTGAAFDVKPPAAQMAAWRAAERQVSRYQTTWGLGRDFIGQTQNKEALSRCARLGLAEVRAVQAELGADRADLPVDLVEHQTRRQLDALLQKAGVHTARLPFPLAHLSALACLLAFRSAKETQGGS